ncbi:MAG: hypothetical protein KKC76_05440 [Proteobacteria bacterium]|nr:hypothetical protein [Pseudomonadota bacterium]MBU4297818.1 hypothetical protein [Pseudomonadota bacterium]MCG2748660.1 hypothetical protein [Desulfobulbaceae bacterium]
MATNYDNKVQCYFIATVGRPATPAELTTYGEALESNNGNVWRAGLISYLNDEAGLASRLDYMNLVGEVYENLTGDSSAAMPEAAYEYYFTHLLSGGLKTKGLANAMINDFALMPTADGTYGQPPQWTPQNRGMLPDNGAEALLTIQNRVTSANLFTVGIDTDAETLAYNVTAYNGVHQWISGVTSSPASQAEVDTTLASLDLLSSLVESSGNLVLSGALTYTMTIDLQDQEIKINAIDYSLSEGSLADVGTIDASALTGTKSISFTGGSSAENYVASSAGDTIRGGSGNDVLTGGDGADTYIFEATAVVNGVDTIENFTAGGDDILDFSAFLNASNTGNISPVDISTTAEVAWENGDVLIVIGDGLTTGTDIAALFGAGQPFAAPETRGKAVVIAADIVGDASVWYLVNQSSITTIEATELTQVAILGSVNNVSLVPFVAGNFA